MNARRWRIALAGIVLQMVLGSVYAWSVFRKPLNARFHWTIAQITLAFTVCILMVGISAFLGGLWLRRSGPRVVAVSGALLYGLGVMLSSGAGHGLWWIYLSYGLVGGTGLGLAYIVPVAVLVKWFPDRRGFITGLAVAGFGAGALVTAPIATRLIATVGVLTTFLYLGIAYCVLGVLASLAMVLPPSEWVPEGWIPSVVVQKQRSGSNYALVDALKTWQWWALWFILFINTCAGISLISQEAPVFQELGAVTAAVAAGMVGIVSIGNAVGRVLWASVSDGVGRRIAFLLMFLCQAVLFWFLPGIHAETAIAAIAFLILVCYGGGFGTMPAFAADYFGATNVGSIYGLMLTAWGAASAFGPLLVAHTRERSGSFTSGFHMLAAILLVCTVVPFTVRPPQPVPVEAR